MVGLAERFQSGSDIRLADIYLIINFCFTFSTLIEFAVVSYPASRQAKEARKQRQLDGAGKRATSDAGLKKENGTGKMQGSGCRKFSEVHNIKKTIGNRDR